MGKNFKLVVFSLGLVALMAFGCTKKTETPPPPAPVSTEAVPTDAQAAAPSAEATPVSQEKCPQGKVTTGQFSPEMVIPLEEGRSILVCGSREGVDGSKIRMTEFDLFIKGLDPEPKLFFSANAGEYYNVVAMPNTGVELESLLYLPIDDSGAKSWVPFTKFKFQCSGVGCNKMPEECALGKISEKIHPNVSAQTKSKIAGQAGSEKFVLDKLLPQLLVRALLGDGEAYGLVGTFDASFSIDGDLAEELAHAKSVLSRSTVMPCRFKK